jgi:hypothetical protein
MRGKEKFTSYSLTLNMKAEVDAVPGFLDIPPYVTIVPPYLQGTNIFKSS